MRTPLHAAWRDYRVRRGTALAVGVAGPPLAWTARLLERAGAAGVVPHGALLHHVVAAAWATAGIASLAWFAAFRCPFCRAHFHWTWLVSNPLARRCLHCGFERWRDPDAARRLRP